MVSMSCVYTFRYNCLSFVIYPQMETTPMDLNKQDIDKADTSTYFIKDNEAR